MMTLSDQAATGSADREAVAIALGWAKIDREGCKWVGWHAPAGAPRTFTPPDYQNDLAAVLAEIERRGWDWDCTSRGGGFCIVWAGSISGTATGTTIANAACAALLKALENSDDN